MKKLIGFLVLASTFSSFASDQIQKISSDMIDSYDKIQIRALPTTDLEEDYNGHVGVLIAVGKRVELGVYGAKKLDTDFKKEKFKYDLIGKVEVNHVSLGATVNAVYSQDFNYTINQLDGGVLKDVCGTYGGLKAGLAVFLGSTGFTAINGKGTVLRSSSIDGGFRADVSLIKIKVRCLDEKNANWLKTVRLK